MKDLTCKWAPGTEGETFLHTNYTLKYKLRCAWPPFNSSLKKKKASVGFAGLWGGEERGAQCLLAGPFGDVMSFLVSQPCSICAGEEEEGGEKPP